MTGTLTPRGARTKQRIVEAAAELIYAKGVERVSLDEVMEATRTSRSQIYHYFETKMLWCERSSRFRRIASSKRRDLLRKPRFDRVPAGLAGRGGVREPGGRQSRGGPLGSLANELATESEEARRQIHGRFLGWSAVIEAGLTRLRDAGKIGAGVDTREMAVAILAAVQGGILLSMTARTSQPLKLALDMVLSHVEHHAV